MFGVEPGAEAKTRVSAIVLPVSDSHLSSFKWFRQRLAASRAGRWMRPQTLAPCSAASRLAASFSRYGEKQGGLNVTAALCRAELEDQLRRGAETAGAGAALLAA